MGRHVQPKTETRQPIRPKDPTVPRGGERYTAYPGAGNRLIFYPGSSAGSTVTFGIVKKTSSNPTSNIYFKRNACVCALLLKNVFLGPQDLDRGFGRHVRPYTETRQPIRPKDPAVPRKNVIPGKAYPGLGNRSIFYPGSSVGSIVTFGVVGSTASFLCFE